MTIIEVREAMRKLIKERLSCNPTSQEYVDKVVIDTYSRLKHEEYGSSAYFGGVVPQMSCDCSAS